MSLFSAGAYRLADQMRANRMKSLLRQRARQNVILELGFFIGHLGRTRVCVLATPDVEQPSDIVGIATISTDGEWKPNLRMELRAAGML